MRRDIFMPYFSFMHLPADPAEAARTDARLLTDGAWAAKHDTAFWRGSTTGGIWNASTMRTGVRYKLVKRCRERPDLCDAQITRFSQARVCSGAVARAIVCPARSSSSR